MADETKYSQVQQMATEWSKLVNAQLAQFEAVVAEVGKLEAKGVSQFLDAWEETGNHVKDSLAHAEKLTAEWRKQAIEAVRRSAQFLTANAKGAAAAAEAQAK